MTSLLRAAFRRTYSARALRLHAQAQAHLAASQPDRAESLLRAALATADAADTPLRARLAALLVDATNSSNVGTVSKDVASAALVAAAETAELDVCEAARFRANAANSAGEARRAYEQMVAAFGKESAEAALALSNVGVWLAREKKSTEAIDALREACLVICASHWCEQWFLCGDCGQFACARSPRCRRRGAARR
jgi:hypothetical protein